MSKKKIIAPFYTVDEVSVRSCFHDTRLPNGWLYARGKNRTKITAEDLPEHYIPMTVYKVRGYISVKGIKDIVYYPNYHINHMHRDDLLYISYTTPIKKEPRIYNVRDDFDYSNYDALLWGANIIDFIEAVRKYKSYNIEPIAEEVIKKEKFFMEKHPEECMRHMKLLSENTEE